MYNKVFRSLEIVIYITLILLLIGILTLVIASIIMTANDTLPEANIDSHEEVISKNPEINELIEEPYYKVTPEEREMLAKIVTLEASICSIECQKDVCSVIFNRLESGKWKRDMNEDGKITLYDIIYYPNAFSPVLYGMMDNCKPYKSAYEAVDYVLENGPTVPTYVRYFRASYDFSWEGYENYKTIDNVYFGYFTDWQKGAW